MAIEKYVIDKSDLNALLKGEDLSIQPRGNIKGFCIEIAGNLTNGNVIKAMFNPYKICEYEYSIHVYMTEEDFLKAEYQMNYDANWWNAPYKAEREGKE